MIVAMVFLLSVVAGRVVGRPATPNDQSTHVRAIMPESGTVHENLLRFSVRFDRPPVGRVLQELSLVRSDGSVVDEPFLNEELWSPDGKTLTVILGPGRVKTGLIAHDTLGRPLRAGSTISLALRGQKIARWQVVDPLILPIQPSEWIFHAPKGHTREAFRIDFPQAIDGMDADLIVVVRDGKKVMGKAELSGDQKTWTFRPATEWFPGRYSVFIHPHLEDPYGNEIRSAFETPAAESAHSEREPTRLPFVIH